MENSLDSSLGGFAESLSLIAGILVGNLALYAFIGLLVGGFLAFFAIRFAIPEDHRILKENFHVRFTTAVVFGLLGVVLIGLQAFPVSVTAIFAQLEADMLPQLRDMLGSMGIDPARIPVKDLAASLKGGAKTLDRLSEAIPLGAFNVDGIVALVEAGGQTDFLSVEQLYNLAAAVSVQALGGLIMFVRFLAIILASAFVGILWIMNLSDRREKQKADEAEAQGKILI